MGILSDIEYCDSTLNLQMGCDGCELWNWKKRTCYAGVMTQQRGGRPGWPTKFEQPAIFPERLKLAQSWRDLTGTERPGKPWLNGLPRIVFADDMGDTWTESLPLDWLADYVAALEATPHVYLFLTKRANRMFRFFEQYGRIPRNFWLGASVTGPPSVGRLEWLLRLREIDPQVLLWASLEPFWNFVDLKPYVARSEGALRWLVLGYESGAGAPRGSLDNTRRVRDLAANWKPSPLSFFFKQWGQHKPLPTKQEADRYPQTMLTHDAHGIPWASVGKKHAGATIDGREWRQMPMPARRREQLEWAA